MSITSMFYTSIFLYKILAPKITKLCFGFEVLVPKISYKKRARTTLMKLTPGEQCALGDLPVPIRGHVGTVLNGEPHICGGAEDIYSEIDEKACYRLDKNELQWKSVSISSHSKQIFRR